MKRVRESLPITDPNLKQALMEYGHAINGLKNLFKEDADGNEYLDKIRNADGDTYVEVTDDDVIHFYRAGNEVGQFNSNGLNLAVGKGLVDADGDTYVTVEETADEDIIHFYTAGNERVTIDDSGRVYINCDIDASITDDGALTIGDISGLNLAIDNNEILARNNGSVGNLHLQSEGGAILIGDSASLNIDTVLRLKSKHSTRIELYADTENDTSTEEYQPSILFSQDGDIVRARIGFWFEGNDFVIATNYDNFIKFYFSGSTSEKFRFKYDGYAYADGGWNTFSPILPDVKRYDWVEVAKEDAYKPRKPDDLTMDKMTDEDVEKYGKNIAKIAMANTRAIDYIAHVQCCILRSLINTRRMLYDIRQSTTKESTN